MPSRMTTAMSGYSLASRRRPSAPSLWLALALALPLSLLLTPHTAEAQSWGAFNFQNRAQVSNPNWMSALPGTRRLSQLSIPGTHDSMAFFGGDFTQCQALALPNQLRSGVRALDIRFKHFSNRFLIYHGIIYQNADFDNVLFEVQRFLRVYRGETVLMRVKEDDEPLGSTRTLLQTFAWYAARHPGLFWKYNGDNNPTLAAVRGRVVLLQNFANEQATIGIPWAGLNMQDQYQVPTRWDLYKKWQAIKTQFGNAVAGNENTMYVNFLSGSSFEGMVFPWFVASGQTTPTSNTLLPTGLMTPVYMASYPDFPRLGCSYMVCSIRFAGTNMLTYDYLQRTTGRVGIVYADFPGGLLINRIVRLNYMYK